MEPVAHPVSDSYSLRVYHSQKCVRLAQQQCCRILDDWFAVENCGEVRVRDYYPPWMVVSEPCSYVTMGTRTIVSQRLWTMIYTFCSVLHFTLAMRVPKPGFKVLVFFQILWVRADQVFKRNGCLTANHRGTGSSLLSLSEKQGEDIHGPKTNMAQCP